MQKSDKKQPKAMKSESKGARRLKPAPPDHRIYSLGYVIGQQRLRLAQQQNDEDNPSQV